MLSDRARLQLDAYVQARGHGNGPFRAPDETARFLVGVKMRGEPFSAAELGALMDGAGAQGAERDELYTRVEWGLSLLDVYVRHLDLEDSAYTEVHEYGGFEI